MAGQMDHAVRLDDDGYHSLSISKTSYPKAKFVGDTRTVHDDDGGNWLEGDTVIVYDPQQEEQAQLQLKVGDAAYLTGARKGNAAEIVRIDRFFCIHSLQMCCQLHEGTGQLRFGLNAGCAGTLPRRLRRAAFKLRPWARSPALCPCARAHRCEPGTEWCHAAYISAIIWPVTC